VYTVRLEPVGVEMNVEEGETVLDAAFRQGIAVPHGCKEGRCSACKCLLIEGDVEMLKYSTFALPDFEKESDHILLCRTHVFSDVVVELLNYDEDMLKHAIAVREYTGRLKEVESLTHDIRRFEVEVEEPFRCWAGQYCDITVPSAGVTRSYSMSSLPLSKTLEFIIKKYPDGAFSNLLDGALATGTELKLKGPYGTCFRRGERHGPMVLIGGGSGMAPLWAILNDHIRSGEQRPVRFF
jgi:propane monooxygenase reductase subunit